MYKHVFQQHKARHLRKLKLFARRMLRSGPFKARESKGFIDQEEAERWSNLQTKYGQKINQNAKSALKKTKTIRANSFRGNPGKIYRSLLAHEEIVMAGLRMAKAAKRRGYSESYELSNAANELLSEAINFHLGLLRYTIHVAASSPEGAEDVQGLFNIYRDIAVKDLDNKMNDLPKLLGNPDWKPPRRLGRWSETLSQIQSGESLKELETANIGARAEFSRMIAEDVHKAPVSLARRDALRSSLEVERTKAGFYMRHLNDWEFHSGLASLSEDSGPC